MREIHHHVALKLFAKTCIYVSFINPVLKLQSHEPDRIPEHPEISHGNTA